MKQTIRRFRYYTIMEYDKEEAYLRKMHAKGYRFQSVALPGIYTFVRCEPEDVIYQLDYAEGDKRFSPEEKESYLQLFRDNGWEYITAFMGYTYFRKPATSADTEIFSDTASKRDLI